MDKNQLIELIPVDDERFKEYGRIVDGFDMEPVLQWMQENVTIPEGLNYVPREEAFMEMPIARDLEYRFFGGLSTNLGWVAGHGTDLNALEYHKCSEVNLGLYDFVLFLGRRTELDEEGMLDTDLIKAFYVPEGVMIEMYAGTMHYAPRSYDLNRGYCVFAACLAGTNGDLPARDLLKANLPGDSCADAQGQVTLEDRHLAGVNKWLFAHPESGEVLNDNAPIGLKGVNLDLAATLRAQ